MVLTKKPSNCHSKYAGASAQIVCMSNVYLHTLTYPAADNGNRNLLETNCYCLLLIAHCPSSTPTCLNTTFQSGENDQTTLNWKFVYSSFSTPSDNWFPMIFKWVNLETLPSVKVQSKEVYTNSWKLTKVRPLNSTHPSQALWASL